MDSVHDSDASPPGIREHGISEHCTRCKCLTTTELHPRWVRCFGLAAVVPIVITVLSGVLLAIDPSIAFFGFVPTGLSVGPCVYVLRATGRCQACLLSRDGFAIRRLGLRVFLTRG